MNHESTTRLVSRFQQLAFNIMITADTRTNCRHIMKTKKLAEIFTSWSHRLCVSCGQRLAFNSNELRLHKQKYTPVLKSKRKFENSCFTTEAWHDRRPARNKSPRLHQNCNSQLQGLENQILFWVFFFCICFLGSIYNDRMVFSTRRVYKICSSLVRIRDTIIEL